METKTNTIETKTCEKPLILLHRNLKYRKWGLVIQRAIGRNQACYSGKDRLNNA